MSHWLVVYKGTVEIEAETAQEAEEKAAIECQPKHCQAYDLPWADGMRGEEG